MCAGASAAAELPEWKLPEGLDTEPMTYAFSKRVWSDDDLQRVAEVFKSWRGDGRTKHLDFQRLRDYICWGGAARSRKGPLAPSGNPKKPKGGGARWMTQAIFRVAALVEARGSEMRHLLSTT